jgi:hypothetical protein|tara:strand:+ start:969 stop:1190 length:222 start_codon:yes stop_codon:yes gene_type:complete
MKAREVRERLQGKIEPDVVVCLTAISESLSAQQQEINILAEMMNNLTDILMQLGTTIEGATNAVDELRKIREG